jgi:hypothetical protein
MNFKYTFLCTAKNLSLSLSLLLPAKGFLKAKYFCNHIFPALIQAAAQTLFQSLNQANRALYTS